ncbi:MAG: DNA-3-methyladenine glycosylase I [Chloroflexi bacterium]|nr:DNA-3-methyladenine glycosylase I [Chloroflexota bacterium]
MPSLDPPEQIKPTKLADYLDVMSRAAFQSGMSWKVIEAKWAGSREGCRDFDPQTLVELTPDEVDTIATDTRIIRNRRKVEATIHNAQVMLDLDSEYGGFQKYLRSHPDFPALVKDMRKRFKFMGDMGTYYFLYVVGEEVPSHEEWMQSQEPRRQAAKARP